MSDRLGTVSYVHNGIIHRGVIGDNGSCIIVDDHFGRREYVNTVVWVNNIDRLQCSVTLHTNPLQVDSINLANDVTHDYRLNYISGPFEISLDIDNFRR